MLLPAAGAAAQLSRATVVCDSLAAAVRDCRLVKGFSALLLHWVLSWSVQVHHWSAALPEERS